MLWKRNVYHCFKRPTTGPFSEPAESKPHHIVYCVFHTSFNIIFPSLIFLSDILLSGFEINVGKDSPVDIATRYGLEGLGIESWWRRDFPHPSIPALELTQPPVQWVPGLSRG
jgi:hypothetical protein